MTDNFFPDIFSVFNLLSPCTSFSNTDHHSFLLFFFCCCIHQSPISFTDSPPFFTPSHYIFFSGICLCLFSQVLPLLLAVLVIPIVLFVQLSLYDYKYDISFKWQLPSLYWHITQSTANFTLSIIEAVFIASSFTTIGFLSCVLHVF